VSTAELLAWCVVANVAEETAHGPDGQEVRRGLKHFAPRAKVWVLPPQWGDGGDSVFILGRHRGRGQGRLARLVVPRVHLTDFRVRGVYSAAVHRELTRPWPRWDRPLMQWASQGEAEKAAAWWNTVDVAQSGVSRPRQRGELIAALTLFVTTTPANPRVAYSTRWLLGDLFGNPPDPAGAVGTVLRDHAEAELITAILAPLGDGDSPWQEVVEAARALLSEIASP